MLQFYRRISFICLLLLVSFVSIQPMHASILDQKFTVSSLDGLSSGTAYTIVRDLEGFVWVSTRNGIDRYDGAQVRHYRLNGNQRRGLHDGMMIYLYQDGNGELWVYTERSIIYHYNPLTDTFEEAVFFPGEDGVGSTQAMYVYGDELIFAVSNGLMSYVVGEETKRVSYLLNDRNTHCIEPYTDGCLLIGTNKGLVVYDPERHRCKAVYEHLFVDVRTVCYDPATRCIWVGTNGQGLYCIDESASGQVMRVGNQPFVVHDISLCGNGEVLVGTDGDGLQLAWRTDTGCSLMQFASDTEQARYLIHCSCVRDIMVEEGSIWLPMHFGGVARLEPVSSLVEMSYPDVKSPSDSYVFGGCFDAQDRLWVAYNQSIGCYDLEGNLQQLYLDRQARFLTVHASPDGTVWCGGFNTGLYHFDPETGAKEFFSSVRGSASNDCVYAIHTDTRGYTWIGGLDFGMTCIIPTQSRRVGDDPQKTLRFEHTSIRQICDIDQLNDSVLAVATSDGLYLYNYYTNRQEHLFLVSDDSEWQGTNFFTSLAVRNNREIWMATDGSGLLLYDIVTRKIQSFGLEDGLPSLELRGIELVNDSTLCIASELQGVFSFDCKRRTFQHRLWYKPGSQFQQNSIATDRKGHVMAGCNPCAILFGESDMQPRYDEVAIHIDGHPIIDGTITLPSDGTHLRLQLSTSDVHHQSEYLFFYRIAGLEEEWIRLDDRRVIEYRKMPAGNWEIELRAIGAGGQISSRMVSVVVERDFLSLIPSLVLVILLIVLLVILHVQRNRKNR